MALCSLGVQTGIVQLVGPISSALLSQITVEGAPFTASFAPRGSLPTLVGNVIDENPENTILYKSTKYQLIGGVQICKPSFVGYAPPGKNETASYELIITFVNLQVIGTYPAGIVLVVPIYSATYSNHAGYIRQLINDTNPVASLQTIFFEKEGDTSQTSFAYTSCVDFTGNQKSGNNNLRFYYFPEGIHVTGQDFQSFTNKLNQQTQNNIPAFYLPPVLRNNGLSTVTAFTVDQNGNKQATSTSNQGLLYTTQLSTGSSEFINRFQYFAKPIALSSSSSFQGTCPYYTTSEYKCVPFHKLKDLSGNKVIPGGVTLDTVLNTQAQEKDKIAKGTIKPEQMGVALGITAGVIVGTAILAFGGKYVVDALKVTPSI